MGADSLSWHVGGGMLSDLSWSTCSSRKVAEVELTGFARVFPWGLGWGLAATGTRCPTSAPGGLSGKAQESTRGPWLASGSGQKQGSRTR